MGDVTHDGHAQLREVLFEVPDGVHVQQPLRGVGMAAITGIDHVHVFAHVLGNQVRGAALAVPHHEEVGRHGLQVVDGVEQRFTLPGGGGADVEIHHVGRQAGGGNFEGGAGAGGILEKEVEYRTAAQQGHLLDLPVRHIEK